MVDKGLIKIALKVGYEYRKNASYNIISIINRIFSSEGHDFVSGIIKNTVIVT